MSKISGSCLCGAVRYSTSAEPAMMAVCHCTDCQKQSGSAFSINVLVPHDQIEVEGDALTQFDIKGDSGENVSRNFCNLCGSPLFNVLDHFGGLAGASFRKWLEDITSQFRAAPPSPGTASWNAVAAG